MKQQMIHGLPTTMTHNTPVNKSETPNSQIITREYLIPSYGPNKKRDSPRGLNFPNVFTRKDTKRGLATDYKAMDIKIPIFLQLPSHVIPIFSWRSIGFRRKSTTKSNSQSFRSRVKRTSQLFLSPTPCLAKESSIEASLLMVISYKTRKVSWRGWSPHNLARILLYFPHQSQIEYFG